MGKLADKIAYLKETISIIKEQLSTLTGLDYSDWFLREVAWSIGGIDRFQTPYEHLPEGTYTDPFGTYTVSENTLRTHVVKKECINTMLRSAPLINGTAYSYIDFSYNGATVLNLGGSVQVPGAIRKESFTILNPSCVIYPDTVSRMNAGHIVLYNSSSALSRGLYLPRVFNEYNTDWIKVITVNDNGVTVDSGGMLTADSVNVKGPVGMCSRCIYLQMLTMTADTMVGLFNNLKDVSAEADTYRISVGSTNLAKLTTAQKNIAINKGWILS